VTSFDASIIHWLNQFAQRSHSFDAAMVFLSSSPLVKGELLMTVIWWMWFARDKHHERDREVLLATFAAVCVALFVGRVLAGGSITGLLPFRPRPLTTPGFRMPFGFDNKVSPRYWSTFPSDHAMLFSAAATGFLWLSRPLGVAAHAYWLVLIAFPRLYLGLHYPTDVLGGAVLGAAAGVALNLERVRRAVALLPLRWLRAHPSSFYACFFLVSVQFSDMFTEVRALLLAVLRALHSSVLGPPP
jgi:undecaprenyl-diphosphatase